MENGPDPDDSDDFVEVDEDEEGGGSFADTLNIFEPNNFQDQRSTFDTPRMAPVNQNNPTVTAAQEANRYEVAQAAASEKRLLVCQITRSGRPVVAQFMGKRRLENWRRPTEDEVQFLKSNGKLVKGGLQNAPPAGALAAAAPGQGGSIIGTVVKVGVGAALMYGAYRLYKSVKEDEENVEEVHV